MIEWKTGDVITAERLNGMQKEALIVNFVYKEEPEFYGIDKSYNDIKNALDSGKNIYLIMDNTYGSQVDIDYLTLLHIKETSGYYKVYFYDHSFISTDPDKHMSQSD